VPPLSRPPPQHLVRGRALSSGELQAFGGKRGKQDNKRLNHLNGLEITYKDP
jgi:hypothetical protein